MYSNGDNIEKKLKCCLVLFYSRVNSFFLSITFNMIGYLISWNISHLKSFSKKNSKLTENQRQFFFQSLDFYICGWWLSNTIRGIVLSDGLDGNDYVTDEQESIGDIDLMRVLLNSTTHQLNNIRQQNLMYPIRHGSRNHQKM